jgi:acetyl-CoA carboxylase carboxyl transferase subunit alpha
MSDQTTSKPSVRDLETRINHLDKRIQDIGDPITPAEVIQLRQFKRDRQELLRLCGHPTPADRVYLARHAGRPSVVDYVDHLFTDFFEQRGDRLFREDPSIYGGIAMFDEHPVTVIGTRKGKNLQENLACHFGMPCPEGYRKARRLMRQAEKFKRPIITFVDTAGAYPGQEAEENGQGEAIARNLAEMSHLRVPIIAVFTGEGGSGGALALGVANRLIMLENAIYSILSPEGFASILWKDASRSDEACSVMKLTAQDLYHLKVADEIVKEPLGGAHRDPDAVYHALRRAIRENLRALSHLSGTELANRRMAKFRAYGVVDPKNSKNIES